MVFGNRSIFSSRNTAFGPCQGSFPRGKMASNTEKHEKPRVEMVSRFDSTLKSSVFDEDVQQIAKTQKRFFGRFAENLHEKLTISTRCRIVTPFLIGGSHAFLYWKPFSQEEMRLGVARRLSSSRKKGSDA